MTALAVRLDPETRRRLLELRDLDRLVREPGRQRPAPEPPALTVLARRRAVPDPTPQSHPDREAATFMTDTLAATDPATDGAALLEQVFEHQRAAEKLLDEACAAEGAVAYIPEATATDAA
ncbi:MAG: hypothetical protein ACYCVZ_04680, partial [Streptosporangiaceae bacterium]